MGNVRDFDDRAGRFDLACSYREGLPLNLVESMSNAVYVVSMPENHYADVKNALMSGKHVLCNSPIAIRKSECEELLKFASNNGLVLFEAIKTAYLTAYQRLLLLVKSGKIGKVVSVDATCTSMREEINPKITQNSICGWGPTAMLPVFQLLGTEYKKKTIITHLIDDQRMYDGFTKIEFVYDSAVASIKVAKSAKSEGQLLVTGTKGYIYVPAPWWKTDYFELRYEDQTENRRYFYQMEGIGTRYQIGEFQEYHSPQRDYQSPQENQRQYENYQSEYSAHQETQSAHQETQTAQQGNSNHTSKHLIIDEALLGVTKSEMRRIDLKKADIVRRQYLSHMKEAMVTIRPDSIMFNNSCIAKMMDTYYIHLYIDREQKLLIIKACDENDMDGQKWCVEKKGDRKSRKITGRPFADKLYKMMDWSKGFYYKICGTPALQVDDEDELLFVFELKDYERFSLTAKGREAAGVTDEELSEEDLKKLNEDEAARGTKKSKKNKYPDTWDPDSFGPSGADHVNRINIPRLDDLETSTREEFSSQRPSV